MSKFVFSIHNQECIEKSFGQEYQDIFVLSMTGGKRHGTYLEIGASHPIIGNNTYLLSSAFGWSGASIEFDQVNQSFWSESRPQDNFQCLDALGIDYRSFMKQHYPRQTVIDYLQLDIDPAVNTLTCLKRLPHEQYRFRTITFETDAYQNDKSVRDQSRSILRSLGYELVVSDVLYVETHAFEDWYVDPNLVDSVLWKKLKSLAQDTTIPKKLLLTQQLDRFFIERFN